MSGPGPVSGRAVSEAITGPITGPIIGPIIGRAVADNPLTIKQNSKGLVVISRPDLYLSFSLSVTYLPQLPEYHSAKLIKPSLGYGEDYGRPAKLPEYHSAKLIKPSLGYGEDYDRPAKLPEYHSAKFLKPSLSEVLGLNPKSSSSGAMSA